MVTDPAYVAVTLVLGDPTEACATTRTLGRLEAATSTDGRDDTTARAVEGPGGGWLPTATSIVDKNSAAERAIVARRPTRSLVANDSAADRTWPTVRVAASDVTRVSVAERDHPKVRVATSVVERTSVAERVPR
ncbi:MAG TPA: hypothetical protein VF244_01600 [Acidimicrobiales bacterium]